MYGILIYLQRKLVNYNLLILFETENLHFKNFLYWVLPFCYGKHTKYPRMYPTGKMKKKKKKLKRCPSASIYLFILFLFLFSKKKVSENLKAFLFWPYVLLLSTQKRVFFFFEK